MEVHISITISKVLCDAVPESEDGQSLSSKCHCHKMHKPIDLLGIRLLTTQFNDPIKWQLLVTAGNIWQQLTLSPS